MRRLHTTRTIRLGRLAAVLLLALSTAACDVEGDIVIQPEIVQGVEDKTARSEVQALATDLDAQKARADQLEAVVAGLRDENIVLTTDKGFTFRLNPSAAMVLIFAIVGLVVVLVARMKFASAPAREPDDEI